MNIDFEFEQETQCRECGEELPAELRDTGGVAFEKRSHCGQCGRALSEEVRNRRREARAALDAAYGYIANPPDVVVTQSELSRVASELYYIQDELQRHVKPSSEEDEYYLRKQLASLKDCLNRLDDLLPKAWLEAHVQIGHGPFSGLEARLAAKMERERVRAEAPTVNAADEGGL